MGLFNFLKIKKKPQKFGGIIQCVNLNEFWNSLEEEERQLVRDLYRYDPEGVNIRPVDIDHPVSNVKYPANAVYFLEDNAKRIRDEGLSEVVAEKLVAEANRLKQSKV